MNLSKTSKQIKHIGDLAKTISDILNESLLSIKSGISTMELDSKIEQFMVKAGVNGPCKGYEGYPNVSCISINDCVTHGIPGNYIIKDGDIVDIDIVIEKNGYFADVSKTVGVGNLADNAKKIIVTAEECLIRGIKQVRPGAKLGDVGYAIQSHAHENGYSIVHQYCGHFIGQAMHEGPEISNHGHPNKGFELKPGMILCIEPMINEGRRSIRHDKDKWSVRTRDGKLSSRCEHMVLVTETGFKVLTTHPDFLTI